MKTNRHLLFGLAERIQHLPSMLVFPLALVSGWAIPGGSRWAALVFPGDAGAVPTWHVLFGLLAGVLIAGHLLYLGVRSYIEGIRWKDFPFRLEKGIVLRLAGDLVGPFRGSPPRRERYSPWRRAGWWVFLGAGSVAVTTGVGLSFWDLLDTPLVTANLGSLAAVHACAAATLALAMVAHIHAVLDAGRRPRLVLLAITGTIGEEDLEAVYPDELKRIREAEIRRSREIRQADLEQVAEQEGVEQRRSLEDLLREGNDLAREERWTEAANAYQRALEQYPYYSQAQFNLALVLERAGLPDEALAAYRRFMEIDPFHPLTERVQKALRRLEEER